MVFSPSHNCLCEPTLQFCAQCSAIQFYNVTTATVEGIKVIGTRYENSPIYGLTFERCVTSVVQDVSVTLKQVSMCKDPRVNTCGCHFSNSSNDLCAGILLYVTVRALLLNVALNYSNIEVYASHDVVISNATLYKTPRDGIKCEKSSDIEIKKARITSAGLHCVRLRDVNNTSIHYANFTGCGDNGVYVFNSNNTEVKFAKLLNISSKGISLDSGSTDTFIANTYIGHCPLNGIALYNVFNTTIEDTTVFNSDIFCVIVENTSFINFNIYGSLTMFRALHTLLLNSTFTIRNNTINALTLSEASDAIIENVTADASISIFGGEQITISDIHIKTVSKPAVVVYKVSGVTFQNTRLEGISQIITDITDQSAALVLYQSTDIQFVHCSFSHNTISALKAVATNITVTGTLIFSNNTAPLGAAVILQERSVIKLSNDSSLQFTGNHATSVGGAIYVDTNTFYVMSPLDTITLSSVCFFQVQGEVSGKRLLSFSDNSAGRGGDVVYGGHMGLATSTDNSNCLLHFNNISQISVSNNLSVISSQPSRVCVCSSSDHPDCLSVFYTRAVYPGETIYLPAVVVGQDFGTGMGSVYAVFLSSNNSGDTQLEQWQYSQGVSQYHCKWLEYSILAVPTGNIVLVLSALEMSQEQHIVSNETVNEAINQYNKYLKGGGPFPQDLLDFPVYVNISVRPCPLGFTLSKAPYKCECSPHLKELPLVECYIETQTFERHGHTWIGFDATKGTMVSHYCRYNLCNKSTVNITVNTTDDQCNYNRSGILCGGCQHGLSVALGSNRCLSCSNYYLFLIIPFAAAGIVLVFVIQCLDITVSNGYVNSIVFYVNIIQPIWGVLFPQSRDNPMAIFVAWTNLELGIETCFFNGLSWYWKTWLRFVFPLYVWSISGLIIIAAKYSTRISQLMGSNPVSVLATLFLLSYVNLLQTCVTIMSNSIVYYPHSQVKVWYLDGNIEYLGPRHLPLFVVAVMVLVLLCIPYTLTLLCGQWLYKCRNRFVSRMMFRIKPVMDAYYGPLKDKHRYWVGLLLISRAAIHVVLALIPDPNPAVILLAAVILSISLIQMNGYVMGFYRKWYVTAFEVTLLSNLAIYSVVMAYTFNMEVEAEFISHIFVGASILQISAFALSRVLKMIGKKVLPQRFIALLLSWMSANSSEVKDEETSLLSPTEDERLLINRDTLPTYGI